MDLTPLDPGIAVFADAYEFLTLDSLPSLKSWTPSDPQGLQTVCIEIRGAISRHQRNLIEHHPLKSVSFNFDAIKENLEVEGFVHKRGISIYIGIKYT